MLPTLLGALVLLKPVLTKKMVFVSGILFGAGLLMKQPAMFFVCFGATYLLVRDWRAYFWNGQEESAMRTSTVDLQIGVERCF